MTRRYLTDEEVRILRAARNGRLRVNDRGRYVIAFAPRPEREARERLQRWGYIYWVTPRQLGITSTGIGALLGEGRSCA